MDRVIRTTLFVLLVLSSAGRELRAQMLNWQDFRSDELGVSFRYVGEVRPILQKENESSTLMIPLTDDVSLVLVQDYNSSADADFLRNATPDEIRSYFKNYSILSCRKDMLLGYPAWHLQMVLRRQNFLDYWFVARDSSTFNMACQYVSQKPTPAGRKVCNTAIASVSFYGNQNGSSELEDDLALHVAPIHTEITADHTTIDINHLPLLPSMGASEGEWRGDFTHAVKGLLQQAGVEPNRVQVVIQEDACGPHGIACVTPADDGTQLKLIYSRAQAAKSLATPDGRLFIWYVLLHETHHVLTWKEQKQRCDGVLERALAAQAHAEGIAAQFNAQCLDDSVYASPREDITSLQNKKIDAILGKIYPSMHEADFAAEEIFADAFALRQWTQIFGNTVTPEIRDQVMSYMLFNLGRLSRAARHLKKTAPAAAYIIATDLESVAEKQLKDLDPEAKLPLDKDSNEAADGRSKGRE